MPAAARGRLPVTTLLIMGLAFGVYYFVYVDGKRSDLIDWSFRRLGAMAGGVEEQLRAYRRVASNVAARAEDPAEAIRRAAPLELVGEPQVAVRKPGEKAVVATAVREALDEEGAWFMLAARGTWELTARVRVAELAAAVLETNGFDKLLLATAGGRVLYQQGRRDLEIASLAGLLGTDGKPIEVARLSRAAGLVQVDISGEKYWLFAVPCRAGPQGASDAEDGAGSPAWVLGALVRTHRLAIESLKVSASVMLCLLALFVLAVLAAPFLKLLYMGSGERLRAVDGLLVGLCALAGVAVLTLLLLDAVLYRQLSTAADGQLARLARAVEGAFAAELDAARAQLAKLDAEALAGGDLPPVRTQLLRQARFDYLDFDTFFLADENGDQSLKWTVQEQETPLVNVRDRAYFAHVASDQLWSRPGAAAARFWVEPVRSGTTGESVAVLAMPAAARGAPAAAGAGGPRPLLAALAGSMASLSRMVLPPGCGFAIVDADGGILFHADARKSLQEKNLLEETSADRALRALLFAHRSGAVGGRYQGRDHRFYVAPVRGLPWSVVSFRDKTPLRTVNVQIVTTALVCLLAYLSVFVLLFGLAYALPQYRARWVWPDPRRKGTYAQLAAAYTGCLLLHLLLVEAGDPASLFWAGLLVPLVLLLVSYVKVSWDRVYRDEGPLVTRRWSALATRQWLALAAAGLLLAALVALLGSRLAPAGLALLLLAIAAGAVLLFAPAATASFRRHTGPSRHGPYLAAAALLLAVLALLPAVSFFELSYDLHVESMVKHGQVKLVHAFASRATELRALARRVLPPAAREPFLRHRLASGRHGAYHASFFATRAFLLPQEGSCGADDAHDHWLPALLEPYLPLYNDSSVEMARLALDCTEDDAWHWDHRGGRLVLHARGDGPGGALHLASVVPAFAFGPAEVAKLLVSVALLCLVIVWIVRFMTRHVLLLRAHLPLQAAAGPEAAGDPAELLAKLDELQRCELARPPSAWRLERAAWRRHVIRCVTTLREECAPTAALQAVGLALLPKLSLAEMDRGRLRDEIGERARGSYVALWWSLAGPEKLVLVQVAEEGLVSAKCRKPLRLLLARGLVVRDPALRLMNETFRRFVVGCREEVLPIERQDTADSAWARLKRPLVAALLGVAVFFFATQREMFNTTLVFVSAAAGALPQLLNLVEYFTGPKRGTAAPAG
jgi:hypothetical protein